MRHRKSFKSLSRTSAHRNAMMSNMASSLIKHKRIKTTVAKAKELRGYVEPLITRSKEDTTHNRREVFSYLHDKEAVTELFRIVSQKVGDRPGGYTRILKLENRLGDNAPMCYIELVDFNELYQPEAPQKKATRRTRRAGSRKSSTDTPIKEVAEHESKEITADGAEIQEFVEEKLEKDETEDTVESSEEIQIETPEKPEVETPEESEVEAPEDAAEKPAEDTVAPDEKQSGDEKE